MPHDLQSWNARHREAASRPPPPAAFLVESFPLLPRPSAHSCALDLACGAGQNSIFVAERGWPALAVDFSPAALDRAATLAASRQLSARRGTLHDAPHRFSGILLVEADLETVTLPAAAFDLIFCFQYLDRRLFPQIERALRSGGHLLYETFTDLQLARHEGPHNPDHLLHPGELRAAFPRLDVLFYRECQSPRAIASLFARRST
ncbi:MAG TPA: class I SAM-dependent methyltransferase [Candidatus Solibacter sp.]|nr:class I SAM-dependent methyltransferase [Candidatus Solibacter sp.]